MSFPPVAVAQVLAFTQFTVACHSAIQPLVAAGTAIAEQLSGGLAVSLRYLVSLPRYAQLKHAVPFQWAAAPFVEYLLTYLSDEAWGLDEEARPEQFIINALVFVARCVSCDEYFEAGPGGPGFMAVLLPPDRVKKLMTVMVCRATVITKAELGLWEDDAEGYEMDDVS